MHIGTKGLVERNFDLFWNGRIEGQAKDDSGKPARVRVLLLSMDGSRLPGYVKNFLATNPDGSYQFKEIPPGRYTVVVNPDGPSDGFPYDIQYYRSTLQSQDAQVLELGAGQQIKAIDFTLPHLKERTVRVRVTWSDARVAAGAHICVVYEHTKEYGSPQIANGIKDTDQNGLAVIHVYGNSSVRVFANQFVDDAKWNHASTYYSHPVESEASKLPDEIDMVMTSPKL